MPTGLEGSRVSYTIGLIRYAITDGSFRRGAVRQLAASGVDFIQLRDKTLGAAALVEIARLIVSEISDSSTKLLINGRADVASSAGAAGVHLTASADELTIAQVKQVFARAGVPVPIISVSCHALDEAQQTREGSADMILFAPVFEKRVRGEAVAPGTGLDQLRRVCAAASPTKVLALGGVTDENAALCIEAGAAGVAGIRMFGMT